MATARLARARRPAPRAAAERPEDGPGGQGETYLQRLRDAGITGDEARIHPGHRHWAFQLIENAVLLEPRLREWPLGAADLFDPDLPRRAGLLSPDGEQALLVTSHVPGVRAAEVAPGELLDLLNRPVGRDVEDARPRMPW